MNVGELIKELENFDKNLEVVLDLDFNYEENIYVDCEEIGNRKVIVIY